MKILPSKLSLRFGLAIAAVLCASVTDTLWATAPNVVFIFADDLGYGEIEALNPDRSKIPTPCLNRLAEEGMVFTDAHTSSSVCTPSRYSLLTGRYCWQTRLQGGVLGGGRPSLIAPNRMTLGHLFQNQGYATAIIGKWHLDYQYEVPPNLEGKKKSQKTKQRYPAPVPIGTRIVDGPVTRGFDTFFGSHHARSMSSIVSNDEIVEEIDVVDMLPRLTKEVVDYIDGAAAAAKGGKPFFLYFPLSSPHTPIVPADAWEGKGKIGTYADFVAQTDGSVGEVLDALQRNGLSDNTIVIFSSDNGTSPAAGIGKLQSKGHYPSADLRGAKADLWDGGHRVPFLARWPGKIDPGSQCDQLICLSDMMATFADYFGVKLGDDTAEDSLSFLPALSAKPIAEPRTSVVHHSIHGHFSLRLRDWKLLLAPGSGGWANPKGPQALAAGLPQTQLYNMRDDIGETTNLIADHPEKAASMLRMLEEAVERGRTTPGVPQANDAEIDLWKKKRLRAKPQKKTAAVRSEATRFVSATANQPYDGSWESLQEMPVPAWFDDGKIGIFIHWGPYSQMGFRKGGRGYAEHVPKMLYRDPAYYFPLVKERFGGHPPEFGYKDIIPHFQAENWDPDAWAELFDEVGAKYVVMTAEHHDGWANWDSDLTPWNAMDKGPKRDLVGDLGKALRKRGLKYAPSFHRERHQSFFAEKLYVVDAKPLPVIAEEIKRVPEAASLYGPFGTTKEFVDDYVARWKEIQTKYKPDMLWMDDFPLYTRDGNNVRKGIAKPAVKYFDDQVRGMITDFMNDGAARGAQVYVNNKGGNRNWPSGVGCLEKDNLKLKVIGPKWQSCTTFGTSFGYLENDRYKSVEGVIHELVEVISRNGNFLINIGPKGDGTLVPQQVERLQAMGNWLKINGDAIYGSRYWKVNRQKEGHLAFTTNGTNLYAIALKKPLAPFAIAATTDWTADQVKSVRLLGSNAEVKWSMTDGGLQITPPADLGASEHAWSFEIVTTKVQHSPSAIEDDADRALKGTKKVDLDGNAPAHSEKR